MARAVDLGRRLSTEESGWSLPRRDQPLIVVVGSANLDEVVSVDHHVDAGETILGVEYVEYCGGKGVNQAIGAARLATTTLVAEVGNDDAGRRISAHLRSHDVDIAHVRADAASTGRAFIQVSPSGENSIVVLPLANSGLAADRVVAVLTALQPTVVLAQLEVPIEAVLRAAEWAASNGARFVLNPSPVRALDPGLLSLCDPLIANAAEATAILRQQGLDAPEDESALCDLLARFCQSVVVTAGARGAFIAEGTTRVAIVGEEASVIDTTGAGDEFAGALCGHLAWGESLRASAELANTSAATLVAIPRYER